MKRNVWLVILVTTATTCLVLNTMAQTDSGMKKESNMDHTPAQKSDFYSLKAKTLSGDEYDMAQLKGKRVLVVNTASECGSTPQYAQLQELYEMYGGERFMIIGFPSNDFGGQEPGSNEEIATFCQKNYGVTFQMMDKVVIIGEGRHPVYRWLLEKDSNGVNDAEVTWNFNKFLIDENGNWVAHFTQKITPLDDEIVKFASGK